MLLNFCWRPLLSRVSSHGLEPATGVDSARRGTGTFDGGELFLVEVRDNCGASRLHRQFGDHALGGRPGKYGLGISRHATGIEPDNRRLA